MEYTVKRGRRKTCALYVLKDGAVEVRAPLTFPNRQIEEFVRLKAQWIEQQKANRLARREAKETWDPLASGLPLLGTDYPATVREGAQASFDGTRFLLPVGSWEEQRPALEQLYRQLAQQHLPPQLDRWAERMDLRPSRRTINGAKTRWGSCSNRGSINLSWRLMQAPPPCVDYVLVHELCHLRHHDHSPAFWAAVGQVLEDWPQRLQLLRQVERRLADQNWWE